MKDKILCWFDGFPLQFGIVRSLKDIHDCELYAIRDVNKGKKFYEKQKFIKFEKKWFYRDFIKNDKSFDLDYLLNFEKKYGINIWKIIYSDPILYQYNKHYEFDRKEVFSIIEKECRFFELVLEETKPDFLILRITDSSNSQLLQQMCKSLGIKILTLGFPRFGFRANISEEMDVLDYEDDLYDKKYSSKTWDELKNYLHGYAKQDKILKENFRTSKKDWLMGGFQFFKLIIDPKYTKFYRNSGRNFIKSIWVELKLNLQANSRRRFVNQGFLKKIKHNEKFVYFPLQLEPERTLLISAPYYRNQIEVIKNIARSIPVEFFLYVKEHPRQGSEGWRNIDDYKEILNLPNVRLIHPDVSNNILLEKCSAVVTINGTLGLESLFNKKPSIVFADTIYSKLSSVSRITNLEELPKIIKQTIKKTVELEELDNFARKIENNSFELNTQELESKTHRLFYYGGFLFDVKIDEKKVEGFLNQERKTFRKLAEEHVKKIQQHKKYLK